MYHKLHNVHITPLVCCSTTKLPQVYLILDEIGRKFQQLAFTFVINQLNAAESCNGKMTATKQQEVSV